MHIELLITGGTIDKQYNELNGELVFTHSSVGTMLEQGRITLDYSLETIMLKDSLDMNDDDRQKILERCIDSNYSHIIITHGTDTIVQTSQLLANTIKHKTIVLLGAMIPYCFKHSDALFNLGCAICAAQLLPHNVYITMNGKIFKHDEVIKNTEIGEFQSIGLR